MHVPLKYGVLVILLLSGCTAILGIEDIQPEELSLTSLQVADGLVTPAFSPELTSYSAALPLGVSTAVITAAGGPGVVGINLNGAPLTDAGLAIELGFTNATIELVGQDGATREVSLELVRGALSQQEDLLKIGTVANLRQGTKMSVDGNTMVYANVPDPGLEGVTIFRLTAGQWRFEPKAAPPNCPEDPGVGGYGASLAVFGDDLVVGAPTCGSTAGSQGGLLQYNRRSAQGGWPSAQIILDPVAPTDPNTFGHALAVSGDRLAVARTPPGDGDILITFFSFDGTSWAVSVVVIDSGLLGFGQPITQLELDGPSYAFARGASVTFSRTGALVSMGTDDVVSSISLDGNTLVVGMSTNSDGSSGTSGPDPSAPAIASSGAVAIYTRPSVDVDFELQAFIKASEPGLSDLFGASVSLSGDVLLVGAPGEDSGSSGVNGDASDDSSTASGAAYVFVRNGTSWAQVGYIKSSHPDAGDNFGQQVGIADEDGLLISAPGEDSEADPSDNNQPDSGGVFFFQ